MKVMPAPAVGIPARLPDAGPPITEVVRADPEIARMVTDPSVPGLIVTGRAVAAFGGPAGSGPVAAPMPSSLTTLVGTGKAITGLAGEMHIPGADGPLSVAGVVLDALGEVDQWDAATGLERAAGVARVGTRGLAVLMDTTGLAGVHPAAGAARAVLAVLHPIVKGADGYLEVVRDQGGAHRLSPEAAATVGVALGDSLAAGIAAIPGSPAVPFTTAWKEIRAQVGPGDGGLVATPPGSGITAALTQLVPAVPGA